jgi:hypothetical protein
MIRLAKGVNCHNYLNPEALYAPYSDVEMGQWFLNYRKRYIYVLLSKLGAIQNRQEKCVTQIHELGSG